MELRYALLSGILLGGTSMAQWAQPRAAMQDLAPDQPHPMVQPRDPAVDGVQKDGGDEVWYENFANGLAGNNGVGAWTTGGPNGNIWKRSTTGPVGAYSATTQRIGAPATFANGFMAFWSDSTNADWSDPQDPVIVATPVDLEAALISPVLDLSATPFVELVWHQRLRFCCSGNPIFVDVSTDGGTTWPTRFEGAPGRPTNNDPGTVTQKINLTAAIAADPANVRIRFYHDPVASHYHWQIDDVKIVELYDYDLRMTTSGTTNWNIDLATSYDSIRYSVYPYSQLRPLGLNMTVLNNGAMDQADAVANFSVTRSGTTVLDQDVSVPDFAAGETRTIFVTPDFTPPAVAGTYDVDFSISSGATDQVPGDNADDASFAVSEFIYARDGGTLTGSEGGNEDGGALVLCNAFYVPNEVDLHAISLTMANTSEVGSLIVGELRQDDLETVVESTSEVVVTTAMFSPNNGSNFVNLVFDAPVTLVPGTDYMACVQVYGTVLIGTNGVSEQQTSFIYYEGQAGEDWYYTTTTPMIRMNFNPTVGIEDTDRADGAGLGQNFPNPSNLTTTIPYDLELESEVSLQVTDVSGKVVMEQFLGRRPVGSYRMDLNTSQLVEGVYFYTLTAGEARLTKRMTVIH